MCELSNNFVEALGLKKISFLLISKHALQHVDSNSWLPLYVWFYNAQYWLKSLFLNCPQNEKKSSLNCPTIQVCSLLKKCILHHRKIGVTTNIPLKWVESLLILSRANNHSLLEWTFYLDQKVIILSLQFHML